MVSVGFSVQIAFAKGTASRRRLSGRHTLLHVLVWYYV